MKRTSATVLALLFASTKAVNLNGVPGYEAVDDQAEGVHVLDIGANTMSNNGKALDGEAVMDFPGPIRTAFYSQTGSELVYDNANGLWRSLAQKHHKHHKAGEYDTAAVSESSKGTEVFEHALNATDGIPDDRSRSHAPAFVQKKAKVDPISPENYDPWVYKFSKENMGNFPQWHWDANKNWNSQAQQKHHHKKG